jgi:putative adhesin
VRFETFPTPGPVSLEVKIPSGDLDVETGDTAETTVELEVHGRNGDEAERNTRIEMRRRGEGYEVVVDAERNSGIGLFRGRSGDYRVRITAPHDATLRAQVASADIRGRGRYAEVDVKAASGDVEVEQVTGEASINTASGDIEVERVGSGKINSASGDVRIDEASGVGALSVNTASGDVDLRSVASGEVKVNSASGDVEVGIAKGSRLWVDAQSLSGDTESELELESGAPIESDEGPLVELKARTMSGDITVRRA